MTRQMSTILLTIVHEPQQIQLEDILSYCPEWTWNQVFPLADDHSRLKLICLQRRGFDCTMRTPTK